jgi:hypothetical protein
MVSARPGVYAWYIAHTRWVNASADASGA